MISEKFYVKFPRKNGTEEGNIITDYISVERSRPCGYNKRSNHVACFYNFFLYWTLNLGPSRLKLITESEDIHLIPIWTKDSNKSAKRRIYFTIILDKMY